MVRPQRQQLFVALFAFFGIYFFHCSEAKASVVYSSTQAAQFCFHQDRIENAQLAPSKAFSANSDFSNWIPGIFTVAEAFRLSPIELSQPIAFKVFHVVGARDFFIRTGLSPPRLFV